MPEGPARKALRLKIDALKAAVKEGRVPDDIPKIEKIEDLRTWHAPPLSRWRSFSVAAPSGPNADLRAQLDQILPLFLALQSGKQRRTRAGRSADAERDLKLLRNERDGLLEQNSDLILRDAEKTALMKAQEDIISSQRAAIAELTAQIRKISPIRSGASNR